MYVELNHKWISENGPKLNQAFFIKYKNEEKYPERYKLDEISENLEVSEIDKGKILFTMDSPIGYMSFEFKPTQEQILELVEQQENISGDILVKVIELVTKKINKFKALLESIKGV